MYEYSLDSVVSQITRMSAESDQFSAHHYLFEISFYFSGKEILDEEQPRKQNLSELIEQALATDLPEDDGYDF